MISMIGNNSGGSQSSSGHTPNHNCDSNLSTASAGSHNSDKEMGETTPEKRNQSSTGSAQVDRKRRKKEVTTPEERQTTNGYYLLLNCLPTLYLIISSKIEFKTFFLIEFKIFFTYCLVNSYFKLIFGLI